ncbi:MAG: YtxH domain-containing protein [Allomuricauda sp.]
MSEEKKDFGEKAEEAAKEFQEDVKQAFDPSNPESGKTVAIIAHLTLIGWIIAIIMNSSNKTELGSFYIRQVLGIMLLGFVLGIIPVINLFAWIFPVILWIISLIGAINGNQKPVFLLGEQFQNWFKSL